MKILAIGNSFSQDATAFLELFSKDLFVRNLYVGGCDLDGHVEFLEKELPEYKYQHNGEACLPRNVTLKEALSFEKWDYITIQQASGDSGIEKSYYPHIKKLITFVKEQTNAEIVFHQTWAYEKNSNHPHFERYEKSTSVMWNRIKRTSHKVCKAEVLRMIPTGEFIENLRAQPFFDIENGGISIQRDGFHLSLNYGRFAAACVWLKFFTGEVPEYLKRKDLSEGYRLILKEIEKC